MLHIGHVNILNRAASIGDYLIVGVSSDELNLRKKERRSIYNQDDRMAIVSSLKGVSEVFLEESLEKKLEYIREKDATILVMGDDWFGKFDWVRSHCEVIYLPRTPLISTTEVICKVRTPDSINTECE